MSLDVADMGVVVACLAYFASSIWWASRLTANQETLTKIVSEVKNELKEHLVDDREFQQLLLEELRKRNGYGKDS